MHKKEGDHETADPVQDFINWLKKKMHFKVDKKKLLKRVSIFIVLFSLFNVWLYNIEYKRYVSQAPKQFVKAREDFVNALMFHMYYTFLVKTIRIDFMNPILYPLKGPRDHFYQKGLDALPIEEGERAFWFDMFEVRPYNYSVNARYGSLAQHYGSEFSKVFIDEVYKNIEILSLYPITDHETSGITDDTIEVYIDLINLYSSDFHLHPKGFLFRDENLEKISRDEKSHHRLLNIYQWQNKFLNRYIINDIDQYDKVMNPAMGWYSPYRNHYDSLFIISSFILFYKINNNVFECQLDKKYFDAIEESKTALMKALDNYPKTSRQHKTFTREVSYLNIINNADENRMTYNQNPLMLTVDCQY